MNSIPENTRSYTTILEFTIHRLAKPSQKPHPPVQTPGTLQHNLDSQTPLQPQSSHVKDYLVNLLEANNPLVNENL